MCYVFHSNLMQHHSLLRRGLWHTFSQSSITTQALAVLFSGCIVCHNVSHLNSTLVRWVPKKHSCSFHFTSVVAILSLQPAKRRGFLPQPRSVQPSVLIAAPSSGSNSSSIDLDPENRSGYIQERGMLQSHVTMQDPHTHSSSPPPTGATATNPSEGAGWKRNTGLGEDAVGEKTW